MNAHREPFGDCGPKYWLFILEKGPETKTQPRDRKNQIHKLLQSRGVVGFDNCCGNLWAAPHSEGDLALFAVIHLGTQLGFTNHMQWECHEACKKHTHTHLQTSFDMKATLKRFHATDKRSNIRQPRPEPVPPPQAL